MKKTFKEHYRFTEEEIKTIWDKCIFVFDTNTLLDMYRYSRNTVDSFLSVLEDLNKKDRVWIPYHVGYEFFSRRIGVITEYEGSYDSIIGILDTSKNEIQKKYKDHPFLDIQEILDGIDKALSKVKKEIEKQKASHPKWLEDDKVLERLSKIFEGKIGADYTDSKKNEIYKDGETRYAENIPPGYKDKDKPEPSRYGDLIIWNQIIDKAIKAKKPIILITGDIKEDWWLEVKGKRLSPHPMLKKEMLEKANVEFHMYTVDKFMEYADKSKSKVDKEAITEIRKFREKNESKIQIEKQAENDIHSASFKKLSEIIPDYFISLERLVVEVKLVDPNNRFTSNLQRIIQRINESIFLYSRHMDNSFMKGVLLNLEDLRITLHRLMQSFNSQEWMYGKIEQMSIELESILEIARNVVKNKYSIFM